MQSAKCKISGRDFESITEFENVLKTEVYSELSLPSVMLRMEKGGVNLDKLSSGDVTFHINSGNIEGKKTAIIAIYNGERLVNHGGMDKELLLDVDGESYCDVKVEVKCVDVNEFQWDTYLKCKYFEGNIDSKLEERG